MLLPGQAAYQSAGLLLQGAALFAKMKNGCVTTDTCNTARKTRSLFVEEVKAALVELGMGSGENG